VAGFPDQDLEITARAAFGADATTDPSLWAFTDLSDRLVGDPITISRGLLVGNGSRRSASTVITCLNDDGWLTPLLRTSPWWPYVDVGTPMDVRLRSSTTPWISDTFTRTVTGGWGTADSGQAWAPLTGWSVNGSVGQVSFTSVNQVRGESIGGLSYCDAWVKWDASLSAVSTGASHVCGCVIRSDGTGNNYLWAGMEFGVGGTVQWTIRSIQAGNEVIETQVTQPGLTYTANQMLRCEVELIGDTLRARAWSAAGTPPDGWACSVQLTQLTSLDATNAGMRMWCVSGNTNTLPTTISIDNLSFSQPRYPRIEGYITDVQPSFQPIGDGSFHSVVQISIGGIGSRLENRDAPDWSPLRRGLQKSNLPPKVYWPCEDGQGALQAASAFPGASPMVVTGPAVFSFDLGNAADLVLRSYGTADLCSVAAGASLMGRCSPVVGSSAWTTSAAIAQWTPGVGGGVTEVRMMECATPGGTFTRWALVQTLTAFEVRAYNDAAATVSTVASWASTSGYLNGYDVAAAQSGGTITVTLYVNAVQVATGSIAGTLTGVSRVTVNPDKTNTTASVSPFGIRFIVGHVMVHDAALTAAFPYYFDGSTLIRGDQGWGYEFAHRRFGRLCDEERIPAKVVGNPYITGTTQLNVQQPGGFTALVTSAIESESGGLVFEDGFGYAHLPRSARINAPVDLTVDMATYRRSGGTNATEVLQPKLDARGPNYITVKRTGGSESTAAAPEEFRNRRGTITAGPTLDVLYDSDTAQHASWRVHLYADGSDANYPSLSLDLAANPGLIDDYLRLSFGSRVQRTNQPTIAGLGVIDQVIDQMSETFSPRQSSDGPTWTATLDTSPASVWQTGVYNSERWDSASTTLAADVSSSGTVLALSTVNKGDAWTTTEAPFDVEVFGQTTTVKWMSGVGSIATTEGGFETGVGGWTVSNCTVAQSSAFAHAGTYSAQISSVGTPSSCSLVNTTHYPAVAASAYTGTCWVYSTVAITSIRMFASWYTSGAVFLSSSTGPTVPLPANTWTQLTLPSAVAPATTGLVRGGPQVLSPPSGTVVYVDDVDIASDSAVNGAGPYPQNAWVVRDPVITGALKAGSEVHVADPLWWAL
jgi:hypothetical protein